MSAHNVYAAPTSNGVGHRQSSRQSRAPSSSSSSSSGSYSPVPSSYHPAYTFTSSSYYDVRRENDGHRRRSSNSSVEEEHAAHRHYYQQHPSRVRTPSSSSQSTNAYAPYAPTAVQPQDPRRRSLEVPQLVPSSRYDSGHETDSEFDECPPSPVIAKRTLRPSPNVHDMRMISQRFQYANTPMPTKPMLPVTPESVHASLADGVVLANGGGNDQDENEHPLAFPGGSDWHAHTTQGGLTGWAAYAGPRQNRQIMFVTPSEW